MKGFGLREEDSDYVCRSGLSRDGTHFARHRGVISNLKPASSQHRMLEGLCH